MEQRIGLVAESGGFSNGLDGTNLMVRVLEVDEQGAAGKRDAQRIEVYPSVEIDRHPDMLTAGIVSGGKHGGVLGSGRDDPRRPCPIRPAAPCTARWIASMPPEVKNTPVRCGT
jgi:hypothetical protein